MKREPVTIPYFPPRDEARARVTLRLQDFAQADRDTVYPAPRGGDWVLLGLLVVILLGNGLYVWAQRGWDDAIGHALFFGLALFCLYWSAAVYALKLSLSVRVGPHSISLVRGPWRMELPWSEVERLAERTDATRGQSYRWVVLTTYAGRRVQVREDLVVDYAAFRIEVYERHRLWQERGGTWGTNGGGPYITTDRVQGEARWWLLSSGAFLLPAVYILALLPGMPLVALGLLALALLCGAMVVRAFARRQRYVISPKRIEVRRLGRPSVTLGWSEIARVDRTRRAAGLLVGVGIVVGRVGLWLAAHSDARLLGFTWSPRTPEYLTLRGGGRRIHIRLHRLDRPDELLAWVEFYERLGRHAGQRSTRSSSPATSRPLPETIPASLAEDYGPSDPWSGGRGGDPAAGPETPATLEPATPGPATSMASANAMGAGTAASGASAGRDARPRVASRPLRQRIPGYAPVPAPPPDAGTPPGTPAESSDDAWLRETRHQPGRTAAAPGAPGASIAPVTGALPPLAGAASPIPATGAAPPTTPIPAMPTPDTEAATGVAPVAQQPVPGTYPGEWDIPDEAPELGENESTDAVDGLAESFAPWRDDHVSPPTLPRFGPPRTD